MTSLRAATASGETANRVAHPQPIDVLPTDMANREQRQDAARPQISGPARSERKAHEPDVGCVLRIKLLYINKLRDRCSRPEKRRLAGLKTLVISGNDV
ncbi:MAG: hypothetical protein ACT4PE_00300 [Candidatus Eiseniibacteriota bacterium]